MRFSAKGRYGVRAMIDLALHQTGQPISARSIAERQEFSADYLEQIFRHLRRSGLVQSTRGPRGGFVLKRDPASISILDILTALEEPFVVAPCLERHKRQEDQACPREAACAARLLWESVEADIQETLARTTLAQVVDRAHGHKSAQPDPGQDFTI